MRASPEVRHLANPLALESPRIACRILVASRAGLRELLAKPWPGSPEWVKAEHQSIRGRLELDMAKDGRAWLQAAAGAYHFSAP